MKSHLRIADERAFTRACNVVALAFAGYGDSVDGERFRHLLYGGAEKVAKLRRDEYVEATAGLVRLLTGAGVPAGTEYGGTGHPHEQVLVIGEWITHDLWRDALRPVGIPEPRLRPLFARSGTVPSRLNAPRLIYFGERPVLATSLGYFIVGNLGPRTLRFRRLLTVHDRAIERFVHGSDGESIQVSDEWIAGFQRAVVMARVPGEE